MPGVRWKEPAIFSSNRVSFIGCSMYGFIPNENSPKYLEPSSVSSSLLIRSVSLAVALTILPFSISNLMFSKVNPCSTETVLYDTTPFMDSLTGAEYTSPSGMFILPSHLTAPTPLMENVRSVPGPAMCTLSVLSISSFNGSIALLIFA